MKLHFLLQLSRIPGFSAMSGDRSYCHGPSTPSQAPQATGLLVGLERAIYEPADVPFEGLPNNLFPYTHATTEHLQQHQMQSPPPHGSPDHVPNSQLASPSRLTTGRPFNDDSLSRSTFSSSPRCDYQLPPFASLLASIAHNPEVSSIII